MHEARAPAEPADPEVRPRRRRGDGQLPPARRRRDLRHARPARAAVLAALPARRRARATSAPSTATRRARCATRNAGSRGSRPSCCATSTPTRSTSARTTTSRASEPVVLPARFPNLLVNGSQGIAVGMATNIAPHNLRRGVDAIVALIDDPTIDVERLAKHVKGPDFPTGGMIVGRTGIKDAYRSGRGRIIVRGRAHIEQLRGGKSAIIITELPYGVRKGGEGGVIEKIADLVKAGTLNEVPISDDALHDHSDKAGMRIDVELKRDAVPQVVAEQALQAHPAPDARSATTRSRSSTACRRRCRCSSSCATTSSSSERSSRAARSSSCGRPRSARTSSRLPDRARQPRRGDRADPRSCRHRRCARRA